MHEGWLRLRKIQPCIIEFTPSIKREYNSERRSPNKKSYPATSFLKVRGYIFHGRSILFKLILEWSRWFVNEFFSSISNGSLVSFSLSFCILTWGAITSLLPSIIWIVVTLFYYKISLISVPVLVTISGINIIWLKKIEKNPVTIYGALKKSVIIYFILVNSIYVFIQ